MNDAEAWHRLEAMAALQDEHNRLVHPDWEKQGYPYYRAVWVECAELLDHFGWKWWKLQEPDAEQVKLEIVDIWHFGLSELLRDGAVDKSLAARLGAALQAPPGGDFRRAVEALAQACLAGRRFDLDAFAALMRALPLGVDELYRLYIGKNVLNSFRQANGYKAGTYRKTWAGREDNEHLVEIAASLDAEAGSFAADLAAALAARYEASAG